MSAAPKAIDTNRKKESRRVPRRAIIEGDPSHSSPVMTAANLTALEKSGENQISLTDPDSRAMAAYTKVGVGYNVQIAVDASEEA
jgi:hypothetical protein